MDKQTGDFMLTTMTNMSSMWAPGGWEQPLQAPSSPASKAQWSCAHEFGHLLLPWSTPLYSPGTGAQSLTALHVIDSTIDILSFGYSDDPQSLVFPVEVAYGGDRLAVSYEFQALSDDDVEDLVKDLKKLRSLHYDSVQDIHVCLDSDSGVIERWLLRRMVTTFSYAMSKLRICTEGFAIATAAAFQRSRHYVNVRCRELSRLWIKVLASIRGELSRDAECGCVALI